MAIEEPIPNDARFKDERGKQHGRWSVLSYAGRIGLEHAFHCRCACGVDGVVTGKQLRSGRSKSCGCLREDGRPTLNRTHGVSADYPAEYRVWKAMIQRCHDPKAGRFARYGGRGIAVCARWHNPKHFIEDMGPRPSPSHSIERIDNDGNYEPGNCVWVLTARQNQNTSRNVFLNIRGERMCLAEAARRHGIHENTLRHRLSRGLSPEDAVAS